MPHRGTAKVGAADLTGSRGPDPPLSVGATSQSRDARADLRRKREERCWPFDQSAGKADVRTYLTGDLRSYSGMPARRKPSRKRFSSSSYANPIAPRVVESEMPGAIRAS